jgi:hypothetical protein
MGVTIFDESGRALISLTGAENRIEADPRWLQDDPGLATPPAFMSLS